MSIFEHKKFEELNDDERVEYVQRRRHDILSMFLLEADGTKAKNIGVEASQIVRGMLKDMDSSIFTKRRLAVDEVSNENDKRIADMADELMGRVKFMGRDKANFIPTSSNRPVLEVGQLPVFNLTPGEIEPVGNEVDLDAITRKGREIFKGEVTDDSDN